MCKLAAYLCGQYWFSGDPYDPKFPLDILYFHPMGLSLKLTYESMYKDSTELLAWVAEGENLTTFSLHNHDRKLQPFKIDEFDGMDDLNMKLTIGSNVYFGNRYIDDLSKVFGGIKELPGNLLHRNNLIKRIDQEINNLKFLTNVK